MSETYTAVVAGHICVDVIPDLTASAQATYEQMFWPGRLTQVGPVTFSTGGPVSNTGLVLHKLGIDTRLMGKVGADLFGQAVKQLVASHDPHLADGMVVDRAVNTSYTIVINPPGVDRIFLHCPGANDAFGVEDVDYDLLSKARLFHFGYPPIMKLMFIDDGVYLAELFRRAKATGVTTSLDMALPDPSSAAGQADWRHILKATLSNVDIFLPSLEEILYMLRRETYNELCRQMGSPNFLPLISPELLSDLSRELLGLGAKIVCLKLGEQGLYLRTADQAAIESLGRACPADPAAWANQEMWTPCFKVDLVGTTGSGDATIAGFLSALLRDFSPAEAVIAAVAVGACNIEAVDALGGIRSWEETMARVSSGWPRRELVLESPGWRFDAGRQMWIGE